VQRGARRYSGSKSCFQMLSPSVDGRGLRQSDHGDVPNALCVWPQLCGGLGRLWCPDGRLAFVLLVCESAVVD